MNGVVAFPQAGAVSLPACRRCGCTELDPCWRPDQGACAWAEPDLCTACEPTDRAERGLRRWRRRFFILLAAILLFWIACLADALVEARSPPAFEPPAAMPLASPNAPVDSGSTGIASPASRRS